MSKLCIEVGKYYRTHYGQKVGPMVPNEYNVSQWGDWKSPHEPWMDFNPIWRDDGSYWRHASDRDLVSEWTEPTDLTTITMPFGLLDAETQEALKAHGGPYEVFAVYGWRPTLGDPQYWSDRYAYRVKPAPPKPRERWAYGAHMHDTLEAAEAFRARVDAQNPGNGYLDESITRWVEVLP